MMINYLYSILAAVVQGLTEFLPVSSSGHLILLHQFLNFRLEDNLAFAVALHLGTALALIVFFWRELVVIVRAFLQSLIHWHLKQDEKQRLAWFLLLSTIPAAITGYFLEDIITDYFRSSFLVALSLVIVGLLFFLVERYSLKRLMLNQLNWRQALLIGLAQAVALIPGVSRSGITIVAGLGLGFKREQAARFSFLLSLPVILGAGLKELLDVVKSGVIKTELPIYVLGLIVAFMVGWLALRFLLRYLVNHRLNVFGWYRIALGLLLILLIWLG